MNSLLYDARQGCGKARFSRAPESDILVLLPFDPGRYSQEVATLLIENGGGERVFELFPRSCASEEVRKALLDADARQLFPGARNSDAAMCGLFVYFSCLDEAHSIAQDIPTPDGSWWHGIMHRMEGDASNAGYWFHRVGTHPLFPRVRAAAAELGYEWDPFAFIRFCGAPGEPGPDVNLAKRVQLAEWQALFEYCASASGEGKSKR